MIAWPHNSIPRAVADAKARTGQTIGTRTQSGMLQIVRIEKLKGGRCNVIPLSGWTASRDFIVHQIDRL